MSCSLMSEAIPGQYIRHQGFRAKLGLKADEQTKKDASFYSRPGLCGGPGYVSFESAEGFPGHFLKVRGGNEIWLEKHDGSEAFSREATFRLVPGLGNPMGVSIESLAHPGYFIREQGFMVNIFPLGADQSEGARREMTWHIEGAGVAAPMAGPVPTSTAWAQPPPGMSGGPFHGPGGHYPGVPAPSTATVVPGIPGYVPAGSAAPLPSGPGGVAYGYPGAMPAPGTPGSFPAAPGSTVNVFSFNFPSHDLRHQQYRMKISEAGESEQAKIDAQFRFQPSIAGAGGFYSLEAVNFPGYFVHVRPGGSNEVWLDRFDGNPQFAREASWKLVPGLANPSSYWSFESLAMPGYYLRHQGFVCFCTPNADPMCAQDGTFRVQQIGVSPSGYGAPGAMMGTTSGYSATATPYGATSLPSGPAAGWAGGPTGATATTPFAGQPQGLAPSGSAYAPTMPQPYYMQPQAMVPVAGAPGTQQIPGMPQVISGGAQPQPQMMPGGFPGAPGAMAGYVTGYGGGAAPPTMPPGAYPPAMMGSAPGGPAMTGSGQAGMYYGGMKPY